MYNRFSFLFRNFHVAASAVIFDMRSEGFYFSLGVPLCCNDFFFLVLVFYCCCCFFIIVIKSEWPLECLLIVLFH